jgi:ribosome biogenesis GTPase A
MAKNMYQKREERKQNRLNNDEQGGFKKTVINWYPGHMAKTKRLIKENINLIDVVYEVVDSRMPLSSKIVDITDYTYNKPRIIIMTKKDLCDQKETDKWIKYYENQGYKVWNTNLEKDTNIKPLLKLTEEVLKEAKEKRAKSGLLNRKIRVLIVGIPNVGKSTLINRLAGKKVTSIGNKPGVTKSLSWIRVNNEIELLDSPGILWPKLDPKNALNLAALTAIKEETLPLFEVASYILETLNKYYPEILKERYDLDTLNEDVVLDFEKIAQKRGCLLKGGTPDYDKVISLIINDIKNGYIKGITFDRYAENE